MSTPLHVVLSAGSVHYRVLGPEGAPTLVFVHGLLVSGSIWDPVVQRLATEYRCVVPDWPMGSHRTPMRSGADLAPSGMADIVADLLAALDLRDVVLVGNDSGGAVCQLVVTRRPERVGALVLTTCDAFDVFPPSPFGIVTALARLPGLLRAILRLSVAFPILTRLPFAYGRVTKRPLDRATGAAWLRPSAEDARVCRDVCAFLRGFDPAVTIAAGAALREVRIPALVLWAREDRSFPIRLGHALAAALPDAELETVDDAWVFASLDAPAAVAAAIAAFVRRRLPRVSGPAAAKPRAGVAAPLP
jgi:pimeloyl-ACP methyl ester carboxylesterase